MLVASIFSFYKIVFYFCHGENLPFELPLIHCSQSFQFVIGKKLIKNVWCSGNSISINSIKLIPYLVSTVSNSLPQNSDFYWHYGKVLWKHYGKKRKKRKYCWQPFSSFRYCFFTLPKIEIIILIYCLQMLPIWAWLKFCCLLISKLEKIYAIRKLQSFRIGREH